MRMFRDLAVRFARQSSGAVAVEFALLLPVYIAVMFGVIEFGRLIWIRNTMEFAAETAARYGAITSGATNATVAAYAETQMIGMTCAGCFSATVASSTVTVVGTKNFTTLIAAYVPIPSTTITVTATFAR